MFSEGVLSVTRDVCKVQGGTCGLETKKERSMIGVSPSALLAWLNVAGVWRACGDDHLGRTKDCAAPTVGNRMHITTSLGAFPEVLSTLHTYAYC